MMGLTSRSHDNRGQRRRRRHATRASVSPTPYCTATLGVLPVPDPAGAATLAAIERVLAKTWDKMKEPAVGPGQYRCGNCRKAFDSGRSDEEALAELAAEFPGFAPVDCELVCDDCYHLMMGEA